MHVKQIGFLVTLYFLFGAKISYSSGIFGTYNLSGQAYDSKGNLLRNQPISVYDGKSIHQIQSDEQGNYTFEVFYSVPCRSAISGRSYRKSLRKTNPRVLVFSYNDREVEIRTNWKKGVRKKTLKRILRFR